MNLNMTSVDVTIQDQTFTEILKRSFKAYSFLEVFIKIMFFMLK